jgi:hypothetical protein
MTEIIFVVEEAEDGGYIAKSIPESIFTEADNIEELKKNVREAVSCHFDEEKAPQLIRLHFVRDEVIAA